MGGSYKSNAKVLVVHCVDTEGPIGGNVRRRPDGSKEFMDNWKDIKASLEDITCDSFRKNNLDTRGSVFILNWFIMDFTGFSTNPKKRICEYNNTYDNIKSLNTSADQFYWHYHQPPICGTGDMWSSDWESSSEHYNILGHRLIERADFPEAYRAGGTIEDNKCSLWLEDNIMIDFSNRVSDSSYDTSNIFDFNWYNAPDNLGWYHPSESNFIKKGSMKRYIAKCVDLESRLHILTQEKVDKAFSEAKSKNKNVILSYFSHDHRDMREETFRAISMVNNASIKHKIPFEWSDPVAAIQKTDNIKKVSVKIGAEKINKNQIKIYFNNEIYQKSPLVYTKDDKGIIKYHKIDILREPNCPYYLECCILNIADEDRVLGVGCTSLSGNKSVFVTKISDID